MKFVKYLYLVNSFFMFVSDENAGVVACSLWLFYSHCCWELTNSWPPVATNYCRAFELRISHIDVRFSVVYNSKSIVFSFFCTLFLLFVWCFKGWLTSAHLFQNLVIRTKSVEFMPFYLSLATFLVSTSFFLYGLFNYDPFIYVSIFPSISYIRRAIYSIEFGTWISILLSNFRPQMG